MMTNNDLGLHWFDSRSLRSQCRSAGDGAVCRRHLSDMATGRLLEVAAGTGIVTGALALALPRAQLIATDLNQPMLDHAATKPELRGVEFRQADAQCQPEEFPRHSVHECGRVDDGLVGQSTAFPVRLHSSHRLS